MENNLKQRNGCITAWLWVAIIANIGMAIFYAVSMFSAYSTEMALGFGICSIFGVINVLGAILLMRWNKTGFYLFLVSSLICAVVNVFVLKMSAATAISSVFAIVIWWAILQAKKDGVSAWSQLETGWDYKHCRHIYQIFSITAIILFVLTLIAVGQEHNNPYEDILSDYEAVEEDTVAVEEVVEAIGWETFVSKNGECSIEAPDDMRKSPTNDEQVLMLMCTDYDPVCVVVAEPISDVKSIGINNAKEYGDIIVKGLKKGTDATNFKQIDSRDFGTDSYLITYEATVEGTTFRYNLLAVKGEKNYYNCTVFCMKEYASKLQPTIDSMLESFKPLK